MRRQLYVVIGVIAVLSGLIALIYLFAPLAGSSFQSTRRITDPKQISKMVFGFVASPYEDDYQSTRIPGYMENLSKQKLAKVELEVQLMDSKGNRKELVKYSVSGILPGQRKTFDANAGTLDGPRTSSVKVVAVQVAK